MPSAPVLGGGMRTAPRLARFEAPNHLSRSTSASSILLRSHHHEGPVLRSCDTSTNLLQRGRTGYYLGPPRPQWVSDGRTAKRQSVGGGTIDMRTAPPWMLARYPPLAHLAKARAAPQLSRSGQHRSAPHLAKKNLVDARLSEFWEKIGPPSNGGDSDHGSGRRAPPTPPGGGHDRLAAKAKLKSSREGQAFVTSATDAIASRFTDMFKAFQYVDLDRSGTLNAKELRRALDLWNIPIDDKKLSELIAACDNDGDGEVDYKEFVDVLARDTVAPAAMGKRDMQSKQAMGVDSQELLAQQLGHFTGEEGRRFYGARNISINDTPAPEAAPPKPADPFDTTQGRFEGFAGGRPRESKSDLRVAMKR